MPTEITLPPLDGTPSAVTIEYYYAQPGDTVAAGAPLLVVTSDRFVWDIPATTAGTISEILAQPGDSVAVGAPLVSLRNETGAEQSVGATANGRVANVTPLARKIATTHAIDLVAVHGSGRGGRITRADVLSLVQGDSQERSVEPAFNSCFSLDLPTEATVTVPAMSRELSVTRDESGTRETSLIGGESAQAKRTMPLVLPHSTRSIPHTDVPQALTTVEVDLSAVAAYIDAHRTRLIRRGIELNATACIAHAVASALVKHRGLNSVWTDDGVIIRGRIHLAIQPQPTAESTHGPTIIADAVDRNIQGIARVLSNGALESQPDPTFTIIAATGARWNEVQMLENQAAALSVGAVEQRPLVVERDGIDTIAIRPVTILTLAYDSRIIDQPHADAFLLAVKYRLEQFHEH